MVKIIIIIALGVIAAALAGLAFWFFTEWQTSKTDVEGQIATAVSEAKIEQNRLDNETFATAQKLPNLRFDGPDTYGALSFMYPKTWNLYVAKDASNGGDFEAYLNASKVGPVSEKNRFNLRVSIINEPYSEVIRSFDGRLNSKPPKLTSRAFQVEGTNITGTRFDGAFSDDITGSAVLLSINDKTVYIRTDTEAGRSDFETLIQTIRFGGI